MDRVALKMNEKMNRTSVVHILYLSLFSLLLSVSISLAESYQEVDMKIMSVPTDWSIRLTWSIPKTMKPSSVLLIRKEKGYPQFKEDGKVVYFGKAISTVDEDVVADTEYFYRFFLLNSKGEVIAWDQHKEKT